MGPTVELSHRIATGMPSYPGLPAPRVSEYLSHESSRPHYDGQAEFSIGHLDFVGNTGTYLDSPYHRFADREDIGALPLVRLLDLPAVTIDVTADSRAVVADVGDVAGKAVLFRSGWDQRWGTDAYWEPGPYLGADTVRALVTAGPALVGVDFWNVDDTTDPARPAHTELLRAGILIVEHLRGLDALPGSGFRFSAIPLSVEGAASMPVRAWATLST